MGNVARSNSTDPDEPEPFLKLREVSVTIAGNRILEELSLAVESGEFVTLLGPSGCGKTTTLRSIAGLVEVEQGSIRVGRQEQVHTPPHKRGVGYVFQDHGLWPHMTVAEHLGFGLRIQKTHSKIEIRRIVTDTLELVGLQSFADRYPASLSGGQKQRVALARSLALNPRVLLLDEPLSSLDATLREHMRTEIRRLQRTTGITTIMVTHDKVEALSMSDRAVVMNEGQILQVGTPQELYAQPSTEFVARFVSGSSVISAKAVSSATVEIGGKTLVLNIPNLEEYRDTEMMRIAVLPENVRLASEGTQSTIPVRIVGVVYEGDRVKISAELETGNDQAETLYCYSRDEVVVGSRQWLQIDTAWAVD